MIDEKIIQKPLRLLCPLRCSQQDYKTDYAHQIFASFDECEGPGCAWWDGEGCAVLAIAKGGPL